MKLVQLDIEKLEPSSSRKSTYVLLLREIGGDRKLPIVIGPCNAGSIAIYLQSDSNPERPLTHDIIKSITNNFNITISRVVIHTLIEGVFHASFFCFMDGDEEVEIDARTSDAIAIAIRMGCPIFTYNDILQEAGVILTDQHPAFKDENSEELEDILLVAFNNVQNKVAEVEESENKKMLKDILPSGLGGLGNMFG